MFILDTNVISELRKAPTGRAQPQVVTWADSQDPSDLYLSVITIMELEIGVLSLARRDRAAADVLRAWVDGSVVTEFEDRIFPIDAAVAKRCATLHVPQQKSERDAFIAATGLVHGMTVVTRNAVDFADTGVAVLNPWEFPP